MLRGKAIKGVAAGIGLASESISAYNANRREKKAQSSDGPETNNANTTTTDDDLARHERVVEEQHEEEWELDEAQDELNSTLETDKAATNQTPEQLAESFLRNYPQPPPYTPTSNPRLPYPVVLPQRRPKSRKRGFIRAYAPALEEFGIDQAMFLDFLETSNRACQATPWLHAINLAGIGTMFLPSAIGIAVSIAIQLTTDFAIAMDARRKTNSYFDKINEEVFRPRGLYCLLMTWKPESSSTVTSFDLNSTVATSLDHGGSGAYNKMKHMFKSSHGNTYGDMPFPETAPLIFPDLDELAAQGVDGEARIKSAKSSRREFVADYLDRRSQAQFEMEHPDNALNKAPKPQFTSRYADPSHPASSGSALGLITGGYITGDQLRDLRGDRRRDRFGRGLEYEPRGMRGSPIGPVGALAATVRFIKNGRSPDEPHQNPGEGPHDEEYRRRSGGRVGSRNPRERLQNRGGPIGGIQKFLKSNVLYMMIVNLPSEEEMAQARAALRS
ncbi:hypothetical protein BDV35DRAFT_359901 [Aspergillus flavus]|uniref:FAD binding domain protein n=2 Tax=Aspergillus subgen. Circumdati TaxID=2720871 RepID=A0A5N6GR58_ASPFL|nr:hypothetical protein Ao3042_02308 [Aspergillus oryzae 3.042]KAB8244395.1 hypothetical protein BDV35DRAFT_359901 [Aspergillus flavus]KDE85855.1 hypothetical protein AO1008_02912 [Aspergillus oryzae 100-8]|eukprot:EIT81224.1 hypothetical protein Ao3042_02308 [Aspergillus oryzae 3.042]